MTLSQTAKTASASTPDLLDESLASIRQALEGLRFGSIAVTVHEGRVVQIDVTEKRRFTPR